MPDLNGFSAWIEVEGERLDEYKVEVDADGCTVRCWVPSQVGKRFMIYWQDNAKSVGATLGKVLVDGQWADSPILEPRNWEFPAVCAAACLDDHSEASFQFSAVTLTDDDSVANEDENIIKNLGTISVSIKKIAVGGKATMRHQERKEVGPIHEASKKAGAHRVALGPATSSTCNETLSYTLLDSNNPLPHVMFIFQYRPRDVLQALDVIEAPNGSGNNEQENENEEQNDPEEEERRRLEEALEEVRARRAKRKRDKEIGLSPNKRIKQEPI